MEMEGKYYIRWYDESANTAGTVGDRYTTKREATKAMREYQRDEQDKDITYSVEKLEDDDLSY